MGKIVSRETFFPVYLVVSDILFIFAPLNNKVENLLYGYKRNSIAS